MMAESFWPGERHVCQCPEGTLVEVGTDEQPTGVVLTMPAAHSCDYVAWRNTFIPEAAAQADSACTNGTPEWTRAFLAAMEALIEAARQGS